MRMLSSLFLMLTCFLGFGIPGSYAQGKVPELNLSQILKPEKPLKLSGVAASIAYVPLETTKDCLFTPSQYLVRGDRVYIRDRDNGRVFLFSTQGRFIREIGTIGKGPREHLGAAYMQASPSGDRVYLHSKKSRRLTCYSAEGEKLSEYAVMYPSWWFAPLAHEKQVFITPFGFPSPDSAAFLFYIQDSKGRVTRKYPAYREIYRRSSCRSTLWAFSKSMHNTRSSSTLWIQ